MNNDFLAEFRQPYSPDAEQAVLGAVLIDRDCFGCVSAHCMPEDFYIQQHQEIAKIIWHLDSTGKPFDAITVLDMLKGRNVFDDEGGKQYLYQLAQFVPTSANAQSYAKIVHDKAMLRSLINIGRQLTDQAASEAASFTEIMENAEQRLYELRIGHHTKELRPIGEIIIEDVYAHLQNVANNNDPPGVKTGLQELDKKIGSFAPGRLILIGARPGVGKTSVCLNFALTAARHGKHAALFTMEMEDMEIGERILSNETGIDGTKIRSGKMDALEWSSIGNATQSLYGKPIYLDDSTGLTVQHIKSKIRSGIKDAESGNKVPFDIAFIDYLGLLESGKSDDRYENRVQEISKMTRQLKIMARDLGIPIVVASQLNRDSERGGAPRKPRLADLRDSGSIEQDADLVLLLHHDKKAKNVLEMIVAKNRHGATGTVYFDWEPEYSRISTRYSKFPASDADSNFDAEMEDLL